MEKPNAVIEITNNVICLVVGYVVNNKPAIIFEHEYENNGVIKDGEVVDFEGLVNLLNSIKVISDAEAHIRITLKEVTLLLPAIGFNVFSSEKSTGVVSQSSIIQPLDIQNAIQLVQKDELPSGLETVDIIPVSFSLEGNRIYGIPPINEKSSNLTIKAFIHTLPKHIFDPYVKAFEQADIAIKRSFVSVYALSELARHSENMPNNYLLVDMGDEVTTVTLVGSHYPYNSTHFLSGGKDLAKLISDKFYISVPLAKQYVQKYGLDKREGSFRPNIGQSIEREDGSTTCFNSKDLTALIESFLDGYKAKLTSAISAVTDSLQDEVKDFPLVFSGGLSSMNGMKSYLKDNFKNECYFLSPLTPGVRHPRFSASVGALLLSSHYRGSLTDQKAKVAEVSREEVK